MAKDNVRDWDPTASNNTDIAGIGIQGTNLPSNFDNALRTVMAQVAAVDAGTEPVNDTWTFCDPADTTKRFRIDAGSITTATTRTYTAPNASGTLALLSLAQTWTATQTFGDIALSGTAPIIEFTETDSSNKKWYFVGDGGTLDIREDTTASGNTRLRISAGGVANFSAGLQVGGNNVLHAGTAVTIPQGGTNATTAAGARTNLAVPGLATANTFTDVQTLSSAAPTLEFAETGVGKSWYVVIDAGNYSIRETTTAGANIRFNILAGGGIEIPGTIDSDGTYASTTASAANMVIQATGLMQRSTSALKYKDDVQSIPASMLDAFLGLSGVTYKSKCEGDDQEKRHVGMIADYAHAAGLTELVTYGETGEVEGFQYDRCVALLLEAVKSLRERISVLEAK